MSSIDIFYQGHGIHDIEHIEIAGDETIATVKAMLVKKHGGDDTAEIFAENGEEPLAGGTKIGDVAGPAGAKLHVHRCRRVTVSVNFAGRSTTHNFAPGTTVARVKHWAVVKQFGMTEEEAGEHVLQIAGTKDRLAPGTHIGTLTFGKECAVKFDLVPDQRINGAAT